MRAWTFVASICNAYNKNLLYGLIYSLITMLRAGIENSLAEIISLVSYNLVSIYIENLIVHNPAFTCNPEMSSLVWKPTNWHIQTVKMSGSCPKLRLAHVRIQWGGQGVQTTQKNHKNVGFLSNTGPDPLKSTRLPSQHSMLDHHRPASETPFKWCFAGGPMMARFYWYLDSLFN